MDYFEAEAEVKCLHPTSSRREMCTSSVNDVIYRKFSDGAAFYTVNGENVNVMLEFMIKTYVVTLIRTVSLRLSNWPFPSFRQLSINFQHTPAKPES